MDDLDDWSTDKGVEPLADRLETIARFRSFHAGGPMAALDRFALGAGAEMRDGGIENGALVRVASGHLPVGSGITVMPSDVTC